MIDESGEARDETFDDAARPAGSDPTFGYLIAMALGIGLIAVPVEAYTLRYTLLWLLLAGFGVFAWLLGRGDRIAEEAPENIAWGVVFGLIIATPLLAVGGNTLTLAVQQMFPGLDAGVLLAYLVFVMPLAETLFFRGLMQQERVFWLVALLSSLWGMVLFFPMLDLQRSIIWGLVVGLALLMVNFIYSYVKRRNGLTAAWVCQIVVNLILVFFPYVSSL
jgi:hypothetical protein